jgi:hypothetical protein
MDQTNRVFIVSAALLWIFIVFLIILLAWGAPDESIDRLGDLAGYLEDHNSTAAKLIVTFGGLILALLGAVVIIFEVAPPDTGSVKVEKVGAGDVRIGTDEIVQRLEEDLRSIPQLTGVQANVLARGRKAELNLDLYVAAEADLATTSEEACRRARELVEERMGVALDCQPRAQIHYRELRVARAPQAPAPMTSERPAPQASSTPWSQEPLTAAASPSAAESAHEASETSPEDPAAGA